MTALVAARNQGSRKDGLIPYNWYDARNPHKPVQQMLVREIGMADITKPDFALFSDRLGQLDAESRFCREASAFYNPQMSFGSAIEEWAQRAKESDILKFGSAVLVIGGGKGKVVGFRIIRSTNVANGVPTYCFQGKLAG